MLHNVSKNDVSFADLYLKLSDSSNSKVTIAVLTIGIDAAIRGTSAVHLNMELIEGFMGMGGVRIEDNVLIQQDGACFNITEAAGVPKSVSDIELIMKSR